MSILCTTFITMHVAGKAIWQRRVKSLSENVLPGAAECVHCCGVATVYIVVRECAAKGEQSELAQYIDV